MLPHRRANDFGELFDLQEDAARCEELRLDPWDFYQEVQCNDEEIRRFIMHTVYWLSCCHGNRRTIEFSEVEWEYLGATADDIKRNEEWLEKRKNEV